MDLILGLGTPYAVGRPKKCRAPWHGLTQQRADCLGAQGLEVWSQGSWACHCFMPQTSAEEESPPQQMGELSPVPSHGPGLEVGRPRGPNYGPFLLGLLPPRRGSALAWRVGGHSCCGTKTRSKDGVLLWARCWIPPSVWKLQPKGPAPTAPAGRLSLLPLPEPCIRGGAGPELTVGPGRR